ncbi:MAG: branched-chain amino acid ABC transporter permease [Deltaproteobacteria bacterium]|nr:branched-chain amino acid ABC transporter permease [Deltaproteobacteria bacterium]
MDLIESYREELQLIRRPWTKAWVSAIVLALFLLPFYAPEHVIYIASIVCIYAIGVQGQNLLIGYTGQISFGQAGFLAIGAYTFGHLARFGVPWPVALLSAGLMAGLFGVIVGFPSLRLKGPYLAIATMGFGIAVYQIFANSELLSGGRMGLSIEKLEPILGLPPLKFNYYFNFLIALLFTLASYNIVSSYMGRAFIAIRDNDIAAEVIGVNLTRYKLLSFAVSSFYTGVQGGLYALYLGFLEPNMFTFMESVTIFVAVIIGGLASIEGSIMGAAFVILVPQLFTSFKEMVPVVFGVAILIVLIFEPLGLAGRWLKTRLYFSNWPFR